ncbi:MAG: hypothetical protein D6693_07410, partial [Planctomycetota bacterium]
LRAFSSIPLAVALLSLVVVYGALASVPIGLLALAPTYLFVAATLLIALALGVAGSVWAARAATRRWSRAPRFAAQYAAVLVGGALAVGLWAGFLWPLLRFDPAAGTGVRFFAGFVEAHRATTLRRLPALEMTEGEFYAWWPLRLILLLFVINMIVATVRRIEFRFENLGVLTVHTGIVILALGSMHYQALKQEGDLLLLAASTPGAPGPAETTFMDRTTPALWVSLDGGPWRSAPLIGLPRYNDYGEPLSDRPLALDLPALPGAGPDAAGVTMRVIGFGAYVELAQSWAPSETGAGAPMLDLTLLSRLDRAPGEPPAAAAELRLPAGSPTDRVARLAGALTIEHVPPGDPRWPILDLPVDGPGDWALAVRQPGGVWRAVAVEPGATVEAGAMTVEVLALHASAPMPIITPGYQGADSEVAVLRITPDTGEPFERWVYARYPELDQDIHGVGGDGRPDRRPADRAIGVALLPREQLHVYVRGDEAVVRRAGGSATRQPVEEGATLDLAPMIALRLDRLWPAAERLEAPVSVPPAEQRKDLIGTHDRSAVAVELSAGGWRRVVWLPFARFMNVSTGSDRTVALPDGRAVRLAFSRAPRALPGLALSLVDFEMVPYPHSEIPRDYVSKVQVRDLDTGRTRTAITRLNAPLIYRVPFRAREDRPALANALGAAVSVIAPNRYKFSQAGWDAEGWRQTSARVRAGALDRPRAAFTILAVGNNPGIHVIAAGAVMVCAGIPWAFYVKPWLLRRRRDRLRAEHAARSDDGARPERTRSAEPSLVGSAP